MEARSFTTRATTMANKAVKISENPFGDFSEEQLQGEPLVDRFYLEGYSDKRHERELDIKAGRKPQTLERRFQFVSVERPDKSPQGDRELEFRRLGYRPVKWEEAAALGLNMEKSAAVKGPDGNVRVGSQLLMVADAATAARHYRNQREATERQYEQHVRGPLEAAADRYNAKHGRTEKSGTHFEFDEKIELE